MADREQIIEEYELTNLTKAVSEVCGHVNNRLKSYLTVGIREKQQLAQLYLENLKNPEESKINPKEILGPVEAILAENGFPSDEINQEIIFLAENLNPDSPLLKNFEKSNPVLAKMYSNCIILDVLQTLSGEEICNIIKQTNSTTLGKAMKIAKKETLDKVLEALPKKDATMLEEDLEYMGPVTKKSALDAAKELSAEIRKSLKTKADESTLKAGIDSINQKTSQCLENYISEGYLKQVSLLLKYLETTDGDSSKTVLETFSGDEKKIIQSFGCPEAIDTKKIAAQIMTSKESPLVDLSIAQIQSRIGYLPKAINQIEKNPVARDFILESTVSFNDLLKISDRDTQKVLREIDSDDCVIALKYADPEIKEKIFRNMSKRQADIIEDEINSSKATIIDSMNRQAKICQIIKILQAKDNLVIIRDGGEYI